MYTKISPVGMRLLLISVHDALGSNTSAFLVINISTKQKTQAKYNLSSKRKEL